MSSVHLEQQLRFGLAARELHGGHRLVHLGEAELRRVSLAIERQTRACRSRRPSPAGSCDARRARGARPAASSRSSAAKPPAHSATRARHGLLHVRVAGQRRCCPRAAPAHRAPRATRSAAAASSRPHRVDRAAAPSAPGRCASGRDARGRRRRRCARSGASRARSGRLRRRARSASRPRRVRRRWRSSPSRIAFRSASASSFCGIEHLGVRDRGAHVVVHQALVERVVFARGVRAARVRRAARLCPRAGSWRLTCRPAARPATAR